MRAPVLFIRAIPSQPHLIPITNVHPNTTTLRGRVSAYEFGGGDTAFSLWHWVLTLSCWLLSLTAQDSPSFEFEVRSLYPDYYGISLPPSKRPLLFLSTSWSPDFSLLWGKQLWSLGFGSSINCLCSSHPLCSWWPWRNDLSWSGHCYPSSSFETGVIVLSSLYNCPKNGHKLCLNFLNYRDNAETFTRSYLVTIQQ